MEGPTSSWGLRDRITLLTLQEHDNDDDDDDKQFLKICYTNVKTYLKIKFFLSPCGSDNTEHFYGSVDQFIFFNCQWYMNGTVAVHTCDTDSQPTLTEDFASCSIHYITLWWLLGYALIPTFYWQPLHNPCSNTDVYIKYNIHTRTPPSNEPQYFKCHFMHCIYFSHNNFCAQKYTKRMLRHILTITDLLHGAESFLRS